MAVIYRKQDRIWLKIGDFKLAVSPLSYHDKAEVRKMLTAGDFNGAALECIARGVKDISGIETMDGSDYKLEFDGDVLSKDCLDDFLNLGDIEKVSTICISLLEGIPADFIDPVSGKELEGVAFIESESDEKK